MFGLLVGRARDGVLEVGIVQRVAQKLHHLPHVALAGDDAKRIVRRLGGVDFRAGQRHARDEVFQILPHASANVKLARLLLHDGIKSVFGHQPHKISIFSRHFAVNRFAASLLNCW